MVKGMNKRVVVVKSPDPKVFEQAIFIVREDFLAEKGKNVNVLKEAEKVADDYLKSALSESKKLLSGLPPLAFAVAGALITGGLWVLLHFIGF